MRKALIAISTVLSALLILALSMNIAGATTTIGTVKIVVNGTTYVPSPATTATKTVTATVTAPAVTVTPAPVTVTAPPATVTATTTVAQPHKGGAWDLYNSPDSIGPIGLLEYNQTQTVAHPYDALLLPGHHSTEFMQGLQAFWVIAPASKAMLTSDILQSDGSIYHSSADVILGRTFDPAWPGWLWTQYGANPSQSNITITVS